MAQPADAMTGVPGLYAILSGGLATGRVFLLEGSPGTGKTTTPIRFLLTGAAAGERGLYITLSETDIELRESAASHGHDIGEQLSTVLLNAMNDCEANDTEALCSA